MSLGFIASNATTVTLDADRSILASSGVVYGIVFANDTASAVTVTCRNAADSANTLVVQIPANASFEVSVARHAPAGFLIKSASSADVHATVMHNNPSGAV